MKSVWMFPGADAIENEDARRKTWNVVRVRRRISEAEEILASSGASSGLSNGLDLHDFMVSPNSPSRRWFQQLVVSSVASQVALFECLVTSANRVPDLLTGCSLGDIARSVCAGAVSFETAILAAFDFARNLTELEGGASFHVSAPERFTRGFRESLENYDLEVSVSQTERHCLIAGPRPSLELWAKESGSTLGLRAKQLYPYPLHTSYMTGVLSRIRHHLAPSRILFGWRCPMFSTIHCKRIETHQELITDLSDNIVSTVRWYESFENLVRLGFRHFVSIGPSPTLIQFSKNSPLCASEGVELEDAFQQLYEPRLVPAHV